MDYNKKKDNDENTKGFLGLKCFNKGCTLVVEYVVIAKYNFFI